MKTEDILNVDCRTEKGREIIQSVLCKIGPMKRYKDSDEQVPIELIEKLISKLCRKYAIRIQQITFTFLEGESDWYTCSIKDDTSHEWLGNVYGSSAYEVLAKAAIKMYALTKKNLVEER